MPDIQLTEQDAKNRERLSRHDFDRNFLVSAGAGAGKTYLTVERAFHMLRDPKLALSPGKIVMITFTRKAATEMKTRMNKWIREALEKAENPEEKGQLQELLDALPEMQISTIHSFCQKVLSEYPLESGVGFAPRYASEDGAPDSESDRFFNEAWQAGRCPECLNTEVRQNMALSAFRSFLGHMNVQPQYVSPADEDGRAFYQKTLEESRRLVRIFTESCGKADPSIFTYVIEKAIRSGERATTGMILSAAGKIASKGKKVLNWMGKNGRKSGAGAMGDLREYLSGREDDEEALAAFNSLMEAAKGQKQPERRDFIFERLHWLPEKYRIVAEAADMLPGEEELAELAGNIDLLIHGVITEEILALCREYDAWCRKNHIISLNDMLLLTAELLKNHPEVRKELREKYRTFFVDEYQDTDPVQTDILMAVAAERYDPDWHRSIPRPGSLFLVGDPKQGIYRFRGADISMWQEAEEYMKATGGEVVPLYKNFRSTEEICGAVTEVFGPAGPLAMERTPYQAAYAAMAAHRGHGPKPAVFHSIACGSEEEGHEAAAEVIARLIGERVRSGQNQYEDFLLLSFNRERHTAYADALRKRHIPVKFDGALPIDTYRPVQLLNLRVQAVCHPFDESLSFRVMSECCGVTPEEWDLFRMRVAELPPDTRLQRYRDSRSLMSHADQLRELLPDTEMNRHVLGALEMLNRDRQLSQSREPCTFLEELTERAEGLFVYTYDREEFRNQYAALLQTIDAIRGMNPRRFTDMAEMLKAGAESSMDRMPTVRADQHFVRLMNLHKAKGLQGKIVIFLPGKSSAVRADSHILRDGTDTLGWFVISDKSGGYSAEYKPPEWEERKAEETEFLKAERVRLKYVALTRAEDEVHVFTLTVEEEGKKPKEINAWEGFEAVGGGAEHLRYDAEECLAEGETDGTEEPEENREERDPEEQQALLARIVPELGQKFMKRVAPSETDLRVLRRSRIAVEEQQDENRKPEEQPSGREWGSVIHRAAELTALEGGFSMEAIRKASEQAVRECFSSELMDKKQRAELMIPGEAVSMEEIRADLTGKVRDSLLFMNDPDSSFRRTIAGGKLYPEIPFTVVAEKGQGMLYDRLKELTGAGEEEKIEVTGKIDLAIRYEDGFWSILDYKTDRMIPSDQGSREIFHSRLEQQYGNQMEIYRAVMDHLTGGKVRETVLISV